VKKLEFTCGIFIGAALENEHFPSLKSERGRALSEIAIVGRSNVGKSSLINHLVRTPGLARVSSSPGKTRTINFYSIDDQIVLVDLPGYGYAKVPRQMKRDWSHFVSDYCLERKELMGVILLLDIRRTPCEEDIAMAAWTVEQKKSLAFVFTKTDKVKSHEKTPFMKNALQPFSHIQGAETFPHILYSVREKSGREHLIRVLHSFL
jgi:GTP-binding protein